MTLKYQRILLKLSGEFFSQNQTVLALSQFAEIGAALLPLLQANVQVGIVIGGGNLVRGISLVEQGFDRVTGDYMGMLATTINGLALANVLKESGIPTQLMSLLDIL